MDIVDIIVGLFFPGADGNTSAFEEVVTNIYLMPLPDFVSPNFRVQYAVMWGLALVISFIVGFISAAFALGKSMTSIGSSVNMAARLLFFVQVMVVGLLATPVLYIIVYMADALGDAAQMAFNHSDKDTTWADAIVKMFNPDGGLDYILKEGIVWLINHEVSIIQLAIPLMVMFTSVAYALSVLGKAGKSIWKIWWALTLTLIFVKPALAWLFAASAWALENVPSNKEGTSFSLIALMIATLLPIILLFVTYQKTDPPIHPMMMGFPGSVSVNAQQGGMNGGSKLLAPLAGVTGWLAAKHSDRLDDPNGPKGSTPRTPGSRRVAAANLASGKAATIASAHPVGAAAMGLGSMALRHSGKRAEVKKTAGAVNPAPTVGTTSKVPTPGTTGKSPVQRQSPQPTQPPAPRPASQAGTAPKSPVQRPTYTPVNPVPPPHAPGKSSTTPRRRSLGRNQNEGRSS